MATMQKLTNKDPIVAGIHTGYRDGFTYIEQNGPSNENCQPPIQLIAIRGEFATSCDKLSPFLKQLDPLVIHRPTVILKTKAFLRVNDFKPEEPPLQYWFSNMIDEQTKIRAHCTTHILTFEIIRKQKLMISCDTRYAYIHDLFEHFTHIMNLTRMLN